MLRIKKIKDKKWRMWMRLDEVMKKVVEMIPIQAEVETKDPEYVESAGDVDYMSVPTNMAQEILQMLKNCITKIQMSTY
jgi:hypothetical protein